MKVGLYFLYSKYNHFCEYHGIIHVKITIRKHFQNVYNTSVLHGMTSISLEYTFERNSQDYACEKTIVQDLICKLLFLSRVKCCKI